MLNALYTILTGAICVIANLRGRLCGDEHDLRWDRTLPWDEPEKDADDGVLYARCCDCGLTHFFVFGKSVTPERPSGYRYRFRAGRGSSATPDPMLGRHARDILYKWCNKEAA